MIIYKLRNLSEYNPSNYISFTSWITTEITSGEKNGEPYQRKNEVDINTK